MNWSLASFSDGASLYLSPRLAISSLDGVTNPKRAANALSCIRLRDATIRVPYDQAATSRSSAGSLWMVKGGHPRKAA